MATDQYTYDNYKNIMSEGDYAQWQGMNAEWNRLFPSFSNFDYNRYLNDAGYAAQINQNITSNPRGDIDNRAAKAQALHDMKTFFEKQAGATGSGFPRITDEQIAGYFDPLRQNTDQLSDQYRQRVAGDVNRASAGAIQNAKEAFAGTGVGRSGIAANQFASIEAQKASQTSGALEKVESARMEQQLQINSNEMSFRQSQDLMEQGFDVADIQSMKNMWMQISMMNFENAAAFEPKSWMDTWGPILEWVSPIGTSMATGGKYGISPGDATQLLPSILA